MGSLNLPGAPARSSFYVVGSRCDVTLRPGKGIIVSTQERALHVCNCGVAERVKQPFVEVVVAPLTGLLTSGWSNTRLVAVNTTRDVDDFHKLPSIINCDAARRSTWSLDVLSVRQSGFGVRRCATDRAQRGLLFHCFGPSLPLGSLCWAASFDVQQNRSRVSPGRGLSQPSGRARESSDLCRGLAPRRDVAAG